LLILAAVAACGGDDSSSATEMTDATGSTTQVATTGGTSTVTETTTGSESTDSGEMSSSGETSETGMSSDPSTTNDETTEAPTETTDSTTEATTGGGADLLFDDFEDAAAGDPPDPGLWTMALVGSNGTITVDNSQAYSGAQSVHIHHEGFSTFMAANSVFPVPDNRFYGRAYMRVAGGLTQGHVTWIEAGVAANDIDEARIGSNIGQLDVNHWPGDEEQRANVPLMPDTWHCIEFLYDGTNHELRIWFEGEAIPGLTVTDWTIPPGGEGNNPNNPIPEWAPSFESVRFGWELGGNGDIWFDDIALATTRVDC